jgi:hypothetical protein
MQIQHQKNQYFVTHGLELLPREVQSLVLQHTHVEFEITHHTEVDTTRLAYERSNPEPTNRGWLVFWEDRLPLTPVVKRYQFKLQRRLGDRESVMSARFSRYLNPELKQTDLWNSCHPKLQEGIVRAAARVEEIEPFCSLQYDELKPGNGSEGLFCFLREHGPQSLAPQWSSFWINSEVLGEVREKMQKNFGQPFSHV